MPTFLSCVCARCASLLIFILSHYPCGWHCTPYIALFALYICVIWVVIACWYRGCTFMHEHYGAWWAEYWYSYAFTAVVLRWPQPLRQLEQMTRASEDLFVFTVLCATHLEKEGGPVVPCALTHEQYTLTSPWAVLFLCGSQHLCWGVMMYEQTSSALYALIFVCMR